MRFRIAPPGVPNHGAYTAAGSTGGRPSSFDAEALPLGGARGYEVQREPLGCALAITRQVLAERTGHSEIEPAFAGPEADAYYAIPVDRKAQQGVVAPVLHGVQDGEEKLRQRGHVVVACRAEAPPWAPGPACVRIRQGGTLVLQRLLTPFFYVDGEGGPGRDWAVEEVQRKI